MKNLKGKTAAELVKAVQEFTGEIIIKIGIKPGHNTMSPENWIEYWKSEQFPEGMEATMYTGNGNFIHINF